MEKIGKKKHIIRKKKSIDDGKNDFDDDFFYLKLDAYP